MPLENVSLLCFEASYAVALALELLQLGVIDVRSMISERLPLASAPEAFDRAARRGALKVLLSN